MYILGISALYHDSAAVLVKDGVILSAVQEERFTRKNMICQCRIMRSDIVWSKRE